MRVYRGDLRIRLRPEKIRPEVRITFSAYDGANNIFLNFAYVVLSWKVHQTGQGEDTVDANEKGCLQSFKVRTYGRVMLFQKKRYWATFGNLLL